MDKAFRLSLQIMKKTLITAFFFGILSISQGQNQCGTDIHYAHLIEQKAQIIQEENDANIGANEYKEQRLDNPEKRASYTIPVVFHVIHTRIIKTSHGRTFLRGSPWYIRIHQRFEPLHWRI